MLHNLCARYSQTFLNDSEDYGHTDLVRMDIVTCSRPPISQRRYNVPLKQCFSLGQQHCNCSKANSTGRTPTKEIVHGLLSFK